MANAAFCRCNKAEAKELYASILAKSPNNYEARIRKAYCHCVLGEMALAAKEYKEAMERTQSDCQRDVAEALYHSSLGDPSKCRQLLETAKRLYPTSFLVLHNLAETTLGLGHFQKSYEAAIEAVNQNPGDCWNRRVCGDALFNLKRYEEAIEHYKVAASGSEPVTLAYIGLANCYYMKNDLAAAQFNFKKAAELNPNLTRNAKNFADYLKITEAEQKARLIKEQAISEKITTRGVGPSGKPKLHFVPCKSEKEAREKAQLAGHGPPEKHIPKDRNELPHYHPTDKSGNKIENGVHYTYPR